MLKKEGEIAMRITEWIREDRRSVKKQESGETTYSVATVDGEKIFQIQSYGTKERKVKGNASQILQFNQQQAKELVELLKSEFSLF